jgi:hypothetical protein
MALFLKISHTLPLHGQSRGISLCQAEQRKSLANHR